MNFADVRIEGENGGLWAKGDGIRIKIPAPMTDRVGPYAGKEVTFGVRPEDMRIGNGVDSAEMTVDATVEVIERLGSEILLDVAVGKTTMVASVEPTATAKVHDNLRLTLNADRLHFFDGTTEAAI
jgi:multiple sugar transport system ATP-binding protein